MKRLKTISKELVKKLDTKDPIIIESEDWKFYFAISGYYNGLYYNIYLMHSKYDKKEIEIAHTTKQPEVFIKLIKDIEPDVRIKYSEITYTTKYI
ncbi:MAG: hypothetical protein QNK20_16675 [Aureibaculum sp.]|nr:hypothetical protein [Aureibaculum sp.]